MNIGIEEHNLALRAREGDAEALSDLVARLRNPLFALAYDYVRHYDDAQDVVAAALLRICARIRTLRDPAQARRWMNAIVRNEARRLLQSRRATPLTSDDAPQAEGVCSAEGVSLLRLDLEAALRRLPQDHARAIALFYLFGLPVPEIARRLGRPAGTIKFWLYRGRQELAGHLKGYETPMRQNAQTAPALPLLWIASIISTDIDADLLAQMKTVLERAGWDLVNLVGDFAAAARLLQTGDADDTELHASPPLQNNRCIVIDERIGAHSAFELIALLAATAERKNFSLFLLVDNAKRNPDFDLTVMAAYAAGVDMLLCKPFDIAEFERFGKRLRDAPASTALVADA